MNDPPYAVKLARTALRWGQIAMVFTALGFLVMVWLYARTESEGDQRRDQTCAVFEGAHAEEIENLRSTYRLLLEDTRFADDLRSSPFVRQELPKQEAEAKSDSDNSGPRVPSYCDDPGVGRREPDPEVPKRPKALDKLVP